jgi:hypothetical protein
VRLSDLAFGHESSAHATEHVFGSASAVLPCSDPSCGPDSHLTRDGRLVIQAVLIRQCYATRTCAKTQGTRLGTGKLQRQDFRFSGGFAGPRGSTTGHLNRPDDL